MKKSDSETENISPEETKKRRKELINKCKKKMSIHNVEIDYNCMSNQVIRDFTSKYKQKFKKAKENLELAIADACLKEPRAMEIIHRLNQRLLDLVEAQAYINVANNTGKSIEDLTKLIEEEKKRKKFRKYDDLVQLEMNKILSKKIGRKNADERIEVGDVEFQGFFGENPLSIRKVFESGTYKDPHDKKTFKKNPSVNFREMMYLAYKNNFSAFSRNIFNDLEKIDQFNKTLQLLNKGWQIDREFIETVCNWNVHPKKNRFGVYKRGIYAATRRDKLRVVHKLLAPHTKKLNTIQKEIKELKKSVDLDVISKADKQKILEVEEKIKVKKQEAEALKKKISELIEQIKEKQKRDLTVADDDKRREPLSEREKLAKTGELPSRKGDVDQLFLYKSKKIKDKMIPAVVRYTMSETDEAKGHPYMIMTEDLGELSIAGPSGSADTLLTFAIASGITSKEDLESLRLAIYASMIDYHHTYHEVSWASKSFGLDYNPGPESHKQTLGDEIADKVERTVADKGQELPIEVYNNGLEHLQKIKKRTRKPI